MLVTVWYGILDLATGCVEYSNGGHQIGPGWRAVLGVFEEAQFGLGRVTMEPGESLVVYTDGIIEAADVSNNLFLDQRLEEQLAILAQDHPNGLWNRLYTMYRISPTVGRLTT